MPTPLINTYDFQRNSELKRVSLILQSYVKESKKKNSTIKCQNIRRIIKQLNVNHREEELNNQIWRQRKRIIKQSNIKDTKQLNNQKQKIERKKKVEGTFEQGLHYHIQRNNNNDNEERQKIDKQVLLQPN